MDNNKYNEKMIILIFAVSLPDSIWKISIINITISILKNCFSCQLIFIPIASNLSPRRITHDSISTFFPFLPLSFILLPESIHIFPHPILIIMLPISIVLFIWYYWSILSLPIFSIIRPMSFVYIPINVYVLSHSLFLLLLLLLLLLFIIKFLYLVLFYVLYSLL